MTSVTIYEAESGSSENKRKLGRVFTRPRLIGMSQHERSDLLWMGVLCYERKVLRRVYGINKNQKISLLQYTTYIPR